MDAKHIALAFVFLVALPSDANASLLGQDITCSTNNPSFPCNVPSNTVGPGIEFTLDPFGVSHWGIDVEDQSVSVTNIHFLIVVVQGALIVTLGDLIWSNDPLAAILGIENFTTNVVGLEEADITTGPSSLTIDYDNTGWNVGAFVNFDLVTSHDIPEPTTLLLLGLGLAGLGFAKKRRLSD